MSSPPLSHRCVCLSYDSNKDLLFTILTRTNMPRLEELRMDLLSCLWDQDLEPVLAHLTELRAFPSLERIVIDVDVSLVDAFRNGLAEAPTTLKTLRLNGEDIMRRDGA